MNTRVEWETLAELGLGRWLSDSLAKERVEAEEGVSCGEQAGRLLSGVPLLES